MSVWIKTERGKVRVIAPECKNRECLHVHWSRHSIKTDEVKSGPYAGAKREIVPLVCVRNEEYGCPHPLPEPRS